MDVNQNARNGTKKKVYIAVREGVLTQEIVACLLGEEYFFFNDQDMLEKVNDVLKNKDETEVIFLNDLYWKEQRKGVQTYHSIEEFCEWRGIKNMKCFKYMHTKETNAFFACVSIENCDLKNRKDEIMMCLRSKHYFNFNVTRGRELYERMCWLTEQTALNAIEKKSDKIVFLSSGMIDDFVPFHKQMKKYYPWARMTIVHTYQVDKSDKNHLVEKWSLCTSFDEWYAIQIFSWTVFGKEHDVTRTRKTCCFDFDKEMCMWICTDSYGFDRFYQKYYVDDNTCFENITIGC